MEQVQIKENKVLYWAAFSLAEAYLLASCFRDVLPFFRTAIRYFKWAAAIIACAAVILVFVSAKKNTAGRGDLIAHARGFLTYEQLFLAFLFFWYIFTCLLRQHITWGHQLKANATWIFVTGMTSFLFFPFAQYSGREKAKQRIELLLKPVLVLYAVFVAWLLWQYFHANYITLPSGLTLKMINASILQLGEMNHNVLARYGLTMMGISLYFLITQKPAVKILYGVCVVLFSAFMILTNSRTNWYVSFAMLVTTAFLFGWTNLDGRNWFMRVGVSVLAAVAIGIFYQWLRGAVFNLLETAIKLSSNGGSVTVSAAAAASNPVIKPQTMACSGYTGVYSASQVHLKSQIRTFDPSDASFGGRMVIYRGCIKVMLHSRYCFLFGLTPSDIVPVLRELENVYPYYDFAHAHNFFLQMGIAYGVPTMLGTIVFAFSLLIRSVRLVFINRNKYFYGAWFVPVFTMYILAGDMLEAELNSSTEIICVVFYLFAGWLVALDETTREKKRKRQIEG